MALMQTRQDDFTTRDETKWNFWGGANVSLNAGRIQLVNNAAASGYWGFGPVAAGDDLTGSYAQLEAVQLPAIAAADPTLAVGFLNLEIDSNNRYFWECGPVTAANTNGTINCMKVNAGAYQNLASFGYDPAVHKWFRIREDAGIVYWGVSPTGYDQWTEYQSPVGAAITALLWSTSIGNWGDAATQQYTAIFDNYNILPAAPTTTTTTTAAPAPATHPGSMLLMFS